MGEVFITRRGGGSGGKLFAIVGVTYPKESICTCTNGSKTFTAKDTSGKALFSVPSIGTWTITATDGAKTKSVSTEIIAEGQCESITISYSFILYSESTGFGEGFSLPTGVTINADSQLVRNAAGGIAIAEPITPELASKYSKLTVKTGNVVTNTNTTFLGLRTTYTNSATYDGYNPSSASYVAYIPAPTLPNTKYEISLEGVKGRTTYFKMGIYNGTISIASIIFE